MPYVYKIIFIPTNQFYIGFRGAKNAAPVDLLTTYFTSSKVVKKLIKEYGAESFKKEIIKEFDDAGDAYKYEQELLKEHLVESNLEMLNKRLTSCALGAFKKHTEKTKRKMSKKRRALWQNSNYREKQRISRENFLNDPAKRKKRKEKYQADEYKKKKSIQTKNLWQTPEYVERVMEAHVVSTNKPEYKKWHSHHKKNLWQDPIYREKQLSTRRKNLENPEYRKRMQERCDKRWKDPEFNKRVQAVRKERRELRKKGLL